VAEGLSGSPRENHLTGKAHGEVRQVISEPAHGLGVIFGKPDPNYTPPGTPVDSPGFKLAIPEDRWKKMTLNQYGEVVPNENEPVTFNSQAKANEK